MTKLASLFSSRRARVSLVGVLGLTMLPSGPVDSAAASTAAALQASMPFADSAFENVWTRNDQPVAAKAVARSWTWGPAPLGTGFETYTDAPDGSGKRLVQYFDKSRMEINNPKLSPDDKWFVTNGLLTVELISGRMQIGNTRFETAKPANINMGADSDDANAVMYSSFGTVSNTSAGEKRQPDKSNGGYATGRINRQGAVSEDTSKSKVAEARVAYFEKSTGHNVPKVFMDFLLSSGSVRTGLSNANKSLLDPWVFAMGLPISDAYWTTSKIGGKNMEVLVQAFERRVLTYAPDLPKGWQVQMGNIGQHYYEWRYGSKGVGPQKQVKGAPGMPVRLTIPVLGTNAVVEYVGVDKDNNMDVPKDPFNVAWFKPGTVPGRVGNAAIAGHYDYYGIKQAVFYYLSTLKPGDRIYMRDDKGQDRAFVVTRQMTCEYKSCPLAETFGPTTATRLNLITCAGVFNRAQQNYDKRTVIFSELVP